MDLLIYFITREKSDKCKNSRIWRCTGHWKLSIESELMLKAIAMQCFIQFRQSPSFLPRGDCLGRWHAGNSGTSILCDKGAILFADNKAGDTRYSVFLLEVVGHCGVVLSCQPVPMRLLHI